MLDSVTMYSTPGVASSSISLLLSYCSTSVSSSVPFLYLLLYIYVLRTRHGASRATVARHKERTDVKNYERARTRHFLRANAFSRNNITR